VVQESLGLGVGDILNLETGEEFEIVGICHTGNAYADNGGIVSLEKAQAIAGRDDKVTLIPIYLNPGADKDKVSQQIEEDIPILEVMTPPKLLEMTVPTQLVDTITWVISLIAAIMGCLGVVTTMSMSVSERTREIGILKTIGWSQFKVWRLILGESLLLSLVGFAIGCLLGVGVTWGIASLPSVRVFLSPAFTPDTFIFGLAMALIFSFLGGIFPAYRAFRLSPAEALRYE
jgi:putative ABC transport system permease protein